MRRTPEQRKAYLEAQLNSVNAKLNKQKRKEANAKRRETDHLKYTFAGDILKVLGCDVREVDLALVLGAVYFATNKNANSKNVELYRKAGLEILKENKK
ncbi:conjugal transfer protein TraD [Klebsiella pneumoniae]|uniref:conjugal transfer protein TraD n=1 Tax=Klebsiella pneumoniae TaxID=573 RepID=UPI0030764E49